MADKDWAVRVSDLENPDSEISGALKTAAETWGKGLPGVNAVPADEAVASYINDTTAQSHQAVVGVLADQPEVVSAAAALAQSDAGLMTGVTHPEVEEDLAFSVVDSRGGRSWLEVASDGGPSDHSMELIRAAEGTHEVTQAMCYGDSTTQGDIIPESQVWPTLLGQLTGWTVSNMGSNGQTIEQVAARYGALPITATISGGTIPASGTVTLTDLSWDLLSSGFFTTLPMVLVCTDDTQVPGMVTKSGGTTIFTRTPTGTAVTASTVTAWCTPPSAQRDALLLLGAGINNEPSIDAGTQTIEQIEALYRQITSLHRGPRIVWGVLDRGPSEAPGTPRGDYIARLETWLATTYGADFLPVRQYLASSQALADAVLFDGSFTPSADDMAAQAIGCVPPCFRNNAGTVHLNPLGHQLQARLIYRHAASPMKGLIR